MRLKNYDIKMYLLTEEYYNDMSNCQLENWQEFLLPGFSSVVFQSSLQWLFVALIASLTSLTPPASVSVKEDDG